MTQFSTVVIGGGFSGAAYAIQAARRLGSADSHSDSDSDSDSAPITIIEPRAELGGGIAYSSDDPDHRLNAPSLSHFVRPDDPTGFHDWWLRTIGGERDPEAVTDGGLIFARRADFGRFVRAQLALCGAQVRHLCTQAITITPARGPSLAGSDAGTRYQVALANGASIDANNVVIATGMAAPKWPIVLPSPMSPQTPLQIPAQIPSLIQSPWDLARIRALPAHARVLLIGAGLTSYDVMITLLRAGHRGQLVTLSRHGQQPQPLLSSLAAPAFRNAPASSNAPADTDSFDPNEAPASIWERLQRPVPEFLQFDRQQHRSRALLAQLRRQIDLSVAHGGHWYEPFDDLRDTLTRLWRQLSVRDQQQALRHLRSWYDSHRYRLPPPTAAIVNAACEQGQVRFRSGRILALDADSVGIALQLDERLLSRSRPKLQRRLVRERFDAVINCTGPSSAVDEHNPVLASLLNQGLVCRHRNGHGMAVDDNYRLINEAGLAQSKLQAIGPPTMGSLADPIGAVFISAHIFRMLSDGASAQARQR